MQISEFSIVVGIIFGVVFFDRSPTVRSSDVILQDSAVDKNGKIQVNLGDNVFEVTTPRDREDVNGDSIFERFDDEDVVAYWESIYGKMDDLPESEDPPAITGKSVELKYVTKGGDGNFDDDSVEISNGKQFEETMKNPANMDESTRSLKTKVSRIARDSNQGRCEITNPLYGVKPVENTRTCEKREISDSEKNKAVIDKTPKSSLKPNGKSTNKGIIEETLKLDSNQTEKSTIPSWLENMGTCKKKEKPVLKRNKGIIEETLELDSNQTEKSTIPSWLENMGTCKKKKNGVLEKNKGIVKKTSKSDLNQTKKSKTPSWLKNMWMCEKRENSVGEKNKTVIENTPKLDVNQKTKSTTPSWLENMWMCAKRENSVVERNKIILEKNSKSESTHNKKAETSSLSQRGSNDSRLKPKLRSFQPLFNAKVDIDGVSAGDLHAAVKSSMIFDSELDVDTKKISSEIDVDRVRRSRRDLDVLNAESVEEIGEGVYNGFPDFTKYEVQSNSKFESTGGRRESSRTCDNCRRPLYVETDSFCPMCVTQDEDTFGELSASTGTHYRPDDTKQNYKRSVDLGNVIESHPNYKCDHDRYANLKANRSDETFRRSPDGRDWDYKLQTPRDGELVPVGFVQAHLSHGHDIALDMHDRARSLSNGGLRSCPHEPSTLRSYDGNVSDELVKLNEKSESTLRGTKLLRHTRWDKTPNNFLKFLKNSGFRITGDRTSLPLSTRCGRYDKFRSFDGYCNNVAHPTWGQSNRAFARILPARYSNGIHGMPVSVTGDELPNPRKLSVRLYSRRSNTDAELTLAIVQWGQTVAHDLGRQIIDQTERGVIACCTKDGKHIPKILQHQSCAPITISPDDKFYSQDDQRCMNFVRTMTISREDGNVGPAEQVNGVTSFLDCSPMYGNDKRTSDELREFTGGRMKVVFRGGRWMLPTMTNRSFFCDIYTPDDICYITGDPRNNQNPQLAILQTLLVREHNRVADALSAINQQWNDERIFQETRRIVIAEYQHITYNEWLPLLLGINYAKTRGLIRTQPGMSDAYDERINPTTIIGFTSGAFRSLHSMIEGDIGLWDVNGVGVDVIRLSDHYSRPKIIERRKNFDNLLRGLVAQRMETQDMNLDPELTEYLFRGRKNFGLDLAALDIQRGRDHGIPGYNKYRKICGLKTAKDFHDLSGEISWENIEKLRRNYAHVDDIDLIVGATMERRVLGSTFGPTNRCLISKQFYHTRVGDRYFYDNANFSHSFTPEQFAEITKATLSRLICDTGNTVGTIQRNAFRIASFDNPPVFCENLPKLNLRPWKER